MSVLEGLPEAAAAIDAASEPAPASATLTPPPLAMFNAGRQYGRDYAAFWSRLATADDPMEVWRAETESCMVLMRDAWTAYADLWMLPLRVWSAAERASET